MHPLLRAALCFCPAEFRSRFTAQIAADQSEYQGATLIGASWNLLLSGIAMHFENLARDVTFALRSLAKAPGYACVAILAFGLAIGANVAVASVLDAVVLRPLPFAQSDRLIMVSQGANLQKFISYVNARDIEARNRTLTGIGLVREDSGTLSGRGKPVYLPGWLVDGSYFGVLGAHAQLGRPLDRRDLGANHMVISYNAWQTYYGGSSDIIGKTLRLDGHVFTIIGVMPADFRSPVPGALSARDFWVPIDPHSLVAQARAWTAFYGIASLKPGVTLAAATADITRILNADAAKYPSEFIGARGATVVPVLDAIVGSTRTLLLMLYAAVGMVLLIACVNIANLTMARTAARERELVVRSALGASQRRVAAQLMTEIAVVALAGGIVGAALAYGVLELLRSVFAQVLPRWEGVSLDLPVLGYAAALVVLTAVLTGLLPLFARKSDMTGALKSAGRAGAAGVGRRTRSGLVIVEVALAVAVIISAGLVVRSFVTLTGVNLGFNPRNLSLLTITLPNGSVYDKPGTVLQFSHRSLRTLQAIPGVTGAAAMLIAPFDFNSYPRAFTIPGRPDPHATVTTNAISPRYFATMQIPLLRGRDFGMQDTGDVPRSAIVNAAFARQYFGTLNVVGKTIAITPFVPTQKAIPQTIVGLAGDTRTSFSRAPEPELYIPFDQFPIALYFVVRTSHAGIPLGAIFDREFAQIDPAIAPPVLASYDTLLARDAVRSQAAMLLFGILALLALVLSLSGIYAVTAYGVEQRTQEFGIRQAVGARRSDILRDVLGGAFFQTCIGITCGLVIAAVFDRSLSGLLFETSPLDPATFAGVIILTICAVVIAAAIPAYRASRIHPAAAIRYE